LRLQGALLQYVLCPQQEGGVKHCMYAGLGM